MNKAPTSPYSFLYLGKGKIEKLSKPQSAYLYNKNSRLCLLTGKKERYSFISFLDQLAKEKLFPHKKEVHLTHLFYEAGHFCVHDNLKDLMKVKSLVSDQIPLAVDICYGSTQIQNIPTSTIKVDLKNGDKVDSNSYQAAFDRGVSELKNGNCYQFNLTFPESIQLKMGSGSVEDLFFQMLQNEKNVGAYAHFTFLPLLSKVLISNSPECLFQGKRKKEGIHLWTMPIKGTVDNSDGKTQENWKTLSSSKKDEGELNMITDLLKNDLCRIEQPSARVVVKKSPLRVPNLLHQFSLLDVKLSKNISLGKIIKALFPGGSITGAPKKNVMFILDQLEEGRSRGFYTGSTILSDSKRLAASINIRSAEYDLNKNEAIVSAGGGITLLSECESEYSEMEKKRESFLQLFQ